MEILTKEQMESRLDFMRPLSPPPKEESVGGWCIPFEYGANEKGTRITVAKARQIAAELLARVAEVERDELRRAFECERLRSENFAARLSSLESEKFGLMQQVAHLTRKLRARRVKR